MIEVLTGAKQTCTDKLARRLSVVILISMGFASSKVVRTCLLLLALMLCAPVSRAQDAMTNPEAAAELMRVFNTAMGAFQSGDYQTAATNLETVIAKAGAGAQLEPVYFTLGASYFNLEQYDKAVETLRKYQEKYPQGARMADATFCMGQASFMAKNYGEAVSQFSNVENIPQLREQALQYTGTAYKEDGKLDEAIQTFGSSFRRKSNPPSALTAR